MMEMKSRFGIVARFGCRTWVAWPCSVPDMSGEYSGHAMMVAVIVKRSAKLLIYSKIVRLDDVPEISSDFCTLLGF